MADEAPQPVTQAISTVSVQHDENWSQWIRSDKSLLLFLYIFLILLLFHASHDVSDKELVSFLREGATGAFSGLMVALRGKQMANVG